MGQDNNSPAENVYNKMSGTIIGQWIGIKKKCMHVLNTYHIAGNFHGVKFS